MTSKGYTEVNEILIEASLNDSVQDIVADFRNTELYTDDFLKDLERGLQKSL